MKSSDQGYIDKPFIVVTIQGEATVEGAGTASRYFLVVFDGVDEVYCIIFGKIVYSNIFNTQSEHGRSCIVSPITVGEVHGHIAVWF